MGEMKKLGIFIVTHELLGQQMDLPKGHKVVGVICPDKSRRRDAIEVIVEGPRMMATHEGAEIMIMAPRILGDE